MKKIKTVFKIDRETGLATSTVTPGAEWVIKGEGVATLKVDGSACMIKDGILYKRYDRKLQSQYMKKLRALGAEFTVTPDMFNVLPADAIPCEEKPDPVTYHHPHWVAVKKDKPEDAFHIAAFEAAGGALEDGTYELIGPKVNNNPYKLDACELVKHGHEVLNIPDRSLEGMKEFLSTLDGEGVVFKNDDGEFFKIRKKDANFFWNCEDTRNLRDKEKMKK